MQPKVSMSASRTRCVVVVDGASVASAAKRASVSSGVVTDPATESKEDDVITYLFFALAKHTSTQRTKNSESRDDHSLATDRGYFCCMQRRAGDNPSAHAFLDWITSVEVTGTAY